jgi:NAD(P)-dependent dehydrogenase (short-subunit alcohol dehydrogenase family)
LSPPFDLTGRTAVVTGGNGGIGFGISRALGRAGAAVAIWARDQDKTKAALAALEDEGIRAVGVVCDVAKEADIHNAISATMDQLGRVDIMVSNAGGGSGNADVVDSSLDEWERVLRTNLTGAFLCFRAAARTMIARGEGGALIAVSSEAATEAAPKKASYAAAKAGLGGLVRSLAVELAPHRIRCNVLMPGWTNNHRMHQDESPPELVTETVAAIPAGRWGTPDDLGTAAVYLADPTLAYHTGAQLVVDGGYSVIPPYLAARAARRGDGG